MRDGGCGAVSPASARAADFLMGFANGIVDDIETRAGLPPRPSTRIPLLMLALAEMRRQDVQVDASGRLVRRGLIRGGVDAI